MNMIKSVETYQDQGFLSSGQTTGGAVVLVMSDNPATVANVQAVCDFLDLPMEGIPSARDLPGVLRVQRPIAVICDIDCEDQDGFHAMRVVADYKRDIPVFMLTDGDPVLMGATDAVQELSGLTSVIRATIGPLGGQLVSFLFSAGRRAGCMRLVPI
jgi:CheY-like chemotaxis protein